MFNHYTILRLVSSFIFPFVCIFALYIQLNGEVSPGGGFQAGAIFASAVISMRMVRAKAFQYLDDETLLAKATALGVLIYAITGIACMIFGGNYLDYDFLASKAITGQHIGIVIIELGVGLTVASTMMLIHLKLLTINSQK